MAKYEAVIIALKIIVEIGMQKSIIFSDSQLVVNQCQGQFKIWDPNLVKYKEKVWSLITRIKDRQGDCELRQVARSYNEEADQLMNKAVVGEQHLTKLL